MKKGNHKLNGIKIGNTYGYVKQKWVKPSFKVTSLYQRYDFEYHYLTERGDSTILYFTGKRGDKKEQYRLRSISFAGIPQYFTVSVIILRQVRLITFRVIHYYHLMLMGVLLMLHNYLPKI